MQNLRLAWTYVAHGMSLRKVGSLSPISFQRLRSRRSAVALSIGGFGCQGVFIASPYVISNRSWPGLVLPLLFPRIEINHAFKGAEAPFGFGDDSGPRAATGGGGSGPTLDKFCSHLI